MGTEECEELISDVTCLDCDLETSQGLAALGSSGVTSAPVVDDNGVLVGVVSITTLAGMRHGDGLEVEDAMRTDVVTASPRASVAEIAKLMATHDLERVPVVTASGRLVGVVTAMDVVRWLAERL
jgi:CBS domain-containing protein